jgi:hypothetical protein
MFADAINCLGFLGWLGLEPSYGLGVRGDRGCGAFVGAIAAGLGHRAIVESSFAVLFIFMVNLL